MNIAVCFYCYIAGTLAYYSDSSLQSSPWDRPPPRRPQSSLRVSWVECGWGLRGWPGCSPPGWPQSWCPGSGWWSPPPCTCHFSCSCPSSYHIGTASSTPNSTGPSSPSVRLFSSSIQSISPAIFGDKVESEIRIYQTSTLRLIIFHCSFIIWQKLNIDQYIPHILFVLEKIASPYNLIQCKINTWNAKSAYFEPILQLAREPYQIHAIFYVIWRT